MVVVVPLRVTHVTLVVRPIVGILVIGAAQPFLIVRAPVPSRNRAKAQEIEVEVAQHHS